MHAKEVADACVKHTKTGRLSARARDVALVAICEYDPSLSVSDFRQRIRESYEAQNPECGSIFLLFVLPLIANLVARWIWKWISNKDDGEIQRLKSQARSSLG